MNTNNKFIIYDGLCGFCNKSIQMILMGKPSASVKFVKFNSTFAIELMSRFEAEFNKDSILYFENNNFYKKSTAILKIIRNFNSNWKYLYYFIIIPRSIRDLIYSIISMNRYRIMGKTTNKCRILSEKEKKYFIN